MLSRVSFDTWEFFEFVKSSKTIINMNNARLFSTIYLLLLPFIFWAQALELDIAFNQ